MPIQNNSQLEKIENIMLGFIEYQLKTGKHKENMKRMIFTETVFWCGNSRVTFFDGKSQLPNFLLMEPDKSFPKAMKMNGIHEGSLSNMSRCMLASTKS